MCAADVTGQTLNLGTLTGGYRDSAVMVGTVTGRETGRRAAGSVANRDSGGLPHRPSLVTDTSARQQGLGHTHGVL